MRKLAAVALALPSLALASGYSLPNSNPRDLGVSASAVAAQSDSGAAYTLPAALAKLNGPSARVAGGGVLLMVDWKDPTGVGGPAGAAGTASVNQKLTAIGNLSIAYGGKLAALGDRGWGVGFGIQPYGGSIVDWSGDWAGRYRIIKVDRQVFSGVLTAGIEVIPRVRIGGGAVYYYTTEELKQHAFMAPFAPGSNPLNPATWNLAQPDASVTLTADGGAWSYDVSAEAQPLADLPLTIAVDYKHKGSQTLKGDVKWQGLTPTALALAQLNPAVAGIFANQNAQQGLTIPNTLNIGTSYRVSKPLLVMLTYTFDRWIVYNEDVFTGANGAQLAVPRNYSNGWTLRGGAEYDLNEMWTVRGGLQYDHSGLDPKHYSPTLPDATTWAASLGGTVRFKHGLSLDAGVFYAWFNEVKAEDPNPATCGTGIEPGIYLPGSLCNNVVPQALTTPEGTFRGTYNTNAFIFGVSLGWTPGATL